MKNFTFSLKWHEILKPYAHDIRREVYDAIIEYVATGTIIEMQPLSRMAFDFIRYEIDEKARRKALRLAKKQNATTLQPKNNSETIMEATPEPEAQPFYDPDKIATEYLDTGRLSTPVVVQSGGVAVVVSREHIHSFVSRCVSDMLERNLTPADNENRFLNTLHLIASNRLDIIRDTIRTSDPNREYTDEVWNSLVNDVCARFPRAA